MAKTLSGGMQRRLNIALALVHNPEIIILDEPQAGLDPQSRILVRDFIRELAHEKTVILTTHDMDEADRLSDRIAIVDQGKILLLDTPTGIKERSGMGELVQIKAESLSEETVAKILKEFPTQIAEKRYGDGSFFLGGECAVGQILQITKVLETNQVNHADITIRKRTLEDAFIEMTGRGLRQ